MYLWLINMYGLENSYTFIDINGVDKHFLCITQYDFTVPQTPSSLITIKLSQHYSKPIWTKTEQYNVHTGFISLY